MLNKIMIGRYYPINSKIHKMNPLSKVICTVIFVLLMFLTNDLFFIALITGFVILILLMSNVPIKVYFGAIKSLKILIFFIILINVIFGINWRIIVIMLARLILVVLYTSALTLTTPPTELTYGLEKFFTPFRLIGIPVNKMALSLSLAIRFIPTIIDQSNKIMKSQTCRGIDYSNSKVKDKLIGMKSLLLPMIIHSFKRADELATSMELRLYNINKKRTNFRMNKWSFFDTYMFFVHSVILVLVVIREVLL
ncbi:MAG: energy-coupling factor transporter transmembrane protein EcfT [Bacilli bacterium]|nr:energy-coupling factor transporter transmembrane protein EcfT [Bacilli bacterium]MDD4282778.1 energy-coupling factor transporter transmembrane protein EcfT [Bacilli bacterium]MDD4718342.1 energy-coupling factor transporter transmembrane protein EcfT [Bacilli bacterium]